MGVWSGGKKRWLGQRESHRSVVWKGKTAAWVKEEATEVWSGKGKLPPGSKGKPPECGLARENCRLGQRGSPRSVAWQGKTAAWVKGKALGVWSDKKNRRLGQRESHRSVAWQGKTAAWVKEKVAGVWSDKKKRRLGQKESRRSVVWWEKAMVGSKEKPPKCGLTRKSAARVKGKALGVWPGGKKRWLGQRGSHRSVV